MTDSVVLTVCAPAAGEELLLVDALRRLGARLVEREGERVVAHLPAPDGPAALVREAEAAIRASTSLRHPELIWHAAAPEELAARWARDVRWRRVTDRLVVVPVDSEVAPGADPGDLVIRLAPGSAFGTAEHATTRSSLRVLERVLTDELPPGARVLDVGAGSGVLSVAAALLGAARVLALEMDPVSWSEARRNVALNGVGRRVTVRRTTVTPRYLRWLGRRDLVLCNLQPDHLRPLLGALGRSVSRGGRLVVSGVPRGERSPVVGALTAGRLRLEAETVEDGWWTGCLSA